MGNWESKPKNQKERLLNSSTNLKNNNNNPKKAKYGFFSKPPNFYNLFNFQLKKNRNTDKNLMVKYDIVNEDLDKDNLAKVFISKIMEKQDITNKIESLQELLMKLFNISIRETSPNDLPEIKKAKSIIKDYYNVYEKQINLKIEKLKSKTNANTAIPKQQNLSLGQSPKPNTSSPISEPQNSSLSQSPKPNASITGGSRKKSKKLRS
jgi:hypothetical protein